MRDQYLIQGNEDTVSFTVPAELRADLDRITVSFKSLQINRKGNVALRLFGSEPPPDYFTTSCRIPSNDCLSSNKAFLFMLNGPGEGLHGHFLLTRTYLSPGGTHLWVGSGVCRTSQGGMIMVAGNTYFAGAISQIRIAVADQKFKAGDIGVLYG